MIKNCVRYAIFSIFVSLLGCKSSTDPASNSKSPLTGSIYYNADFKLYRADLASGKITQVGLLTYPNVLSNGWILGRVQNTYLGEISPDGAQSNMIFTAATTARYAA